MVPAPARRFALAGLAGAVVAAAWLTASLPPPPHLWARLDFNGAPFEDFMGPYFEMACAVPGASTPAPGYHYPAALALLLAPLARLGPAVASSVWLAFELAATALVLLLPLRLNPARSALALGGFVSLGALSHPLLHNLYWGQVSAPLAAALLLAVAFGAKGREVASGVLIGAATAVKLVPALFALGPLVQGRRRVVAISGATALTLLVALPLFTLGWDDMWTFHRVVAERLSRLAEAAATLEGGRGSQDLGAALARWIGHEAGFAVGRVLGLGLAAALVAQLRREREPGVIFTHLALLAPLLVAPTWSHGLAFVPAGAWCLAHAAGAGLVTRGAAVAALALTSMPVHALFASPEAHARAGLGAAAVLLLAIAALVRRAPMASAGSSDDTVRPGTSLHAPRP